MSYFGLGKVFIKGENTEMQYHLWSKMLRPGMNTVYFSLLLAEFHFKGTQNTFEMAIGGAPGGSVS